MKSRISLAVFLLLMSLYSWAQIGGDYNPSNPSDPGNPTQEYTLTLKASPTNGGNFNTASTNLAGGKTYTLRAYPNTDFAFVAWLCNGDTLSKSSTYTYTMPYHDVEIIGVFTYSPSNPSDPQEQALKYQLSLTATPMNSGSFNISKERLAVGSNNSLRAYANTDFVFKRWMIGDSVLSTNPNMDFVMPSHNVQMVGVFEYNPASPANPNRNHWDKQTGEVIVDDFTPGSLSSAISSVISGSSSSNDVLSIIVSGQITSNDFGIANNYKNCMLLDLSRVTGITEVPSYAFDYTNLETVYLPATIEKIGVRAFAECTNLSSLTIYAMTPPALESNVFQGVPEGLVVYVPAAAIALYQDVEVWRKFTLLPIQEDIRCISISLPEGENAADYAQMWLELTNTKSGQRMHYVMTDRQTYTFANIIRNTSWNVTLRNERGDIFGQIDNVVVKDADVSVAFTSLSKPQTVVLSVLTPDGQDVTDQTQVTWTDSQGNYLAQGVSLTGLPAGYQTSYRIVLSQELAMAYNTPQPVDYTLTDGNNRITCQLKTISQVKITGKVKDASTGLALSGAVISASQTFGGKYSKTLNAKTGGDGVFTLDIANVPTSVAFAASDYISQTVNCDSMLIGTGAVTLPDVLLKTITGATITVDFTYTTCDGETQSWYSDYQNVGYELFNVTKNKTISQYIVQYPQIVLLEDVDDGDVLKLTATSLTNSFMPVTATITIDEQKAEATFAILELGKIQSSFTSTSNASVVGSLYDATGKLLKTYNYSEVSLTISDLVDGNYTLVSMGSSSLFNTIYDLAQLPKTGLVGGADYVLNTVEVKSGAVSQINIDEVPTLDESKLYYTGDNASFTVNKPSIVAGNYLTLTGRIDFKPAYATSASNVQMIVDLPESCEFVENSVMVGNSTSSYTLNGNRITIPMTRYTDRIRFCIIPTLGGEYAPSAFVQFDLDGETITQPIGSANYTAKDLSISVPSIVAKTAIPVSGTAIGTSNIEIYDNGVLIGQTTSLANGTWATTCELNEPYNLSHHQIQTKVTTKAGLELQSETLDCTYDMNAIEAKTVTMSFYNGWLKKEIQVVFDLQNKTIDQSSYMFYTTTDITFVADLTNNDTTVVNSVTIRVYTDKNNWRNLEAHYDAKKDRWVAVSQFGSTELPVGVEIEIYANVVSYLDANVFEKGFEGAKDLQEAIEHSTSLTNELASKIMGIIDSEEYSNEEINALVEELLGTIHFNETISPNDKSVSTLLNETENLLSTDLTGLFNIDYNNFEEISNYLDGFSIETRSDLDEETLINDGFQTINCTDGKEYYYKYTDKEYIIAYLPLSKYIVYDLQNIENENETSLSRMRRANDVSDLTTWQGKVYLLCDKLNTVVSAVTNAVDGVISQVDALKGNCQTQLSENLGKFLQNAEEPFLTQKEINDLTKANAKLSKQIKQCEAISNWLSKNLKNFRVSNGAGVAFSLFDIYSITNGIKADGNEIIDLYYAVPDCPKDSNDDNLRSRIRNWGIGCFAFYAGKLAADIVQINSVVVGVTGAVPTGGTSLTAVGIALGIAAASFAAELAYSWQFDKNKEIFENESRKIKCSDDKCPRCGKDPCECKDKCPRCGSRPCTCPEKCPKCGQSPCVCPPPYPQIPPIHDPSGYVYEGVASNRIEGVTATAYYKEMVEDMYGDLHENVVKWDAEEYAQENPLFTDEYGMYAWDVPQGLWQVKFEKEGYETTYSEWLPVPPPQLEVNIAMKQNRQPNVKSARAYEEAVEVEFDKYMMPKLLNIENIMVMQNDTAVEGTVELLDEEVTYEGETETFASKIRFNAAQPFTEPEITLIVNNRIKSYAGIQMAETYTQSFDIEKEVKSIVADSLVKVPYQGSKVVTLYVLPADAAVGKMMHAESSSEMLASLVQKDVTIDENGMAQFEIIGELPGTTSITFSINGVKTTATMIANVDDFETYIVNVPKASLISGSSVYRGTSVELMVDSKDLKIWYTTDGTCPCDENSRKQYTEPIVINSDMVLKAMAENAEGDASEVVTFIYNILQSKMGVSLNDGWNWISFNMKDDNLSSVNTAMASGTWTSDDIIKDNKYVDMYSAKQKQWIGTLSKQGALNNTQMYKVRSSKSQTLSLAGEAVHPRETNITVASGWNYISYLPLTSMSVNDALKNYRAENGDVIKSQDAFATYSATNGWEGDLTTLALGRGYMLKRSANASQTTFTYPVESSETSVKAPATAKSYRYADNMNIIGEVKGICVEEDDSLVAYVNGEVRGACRLERKQKVFLTVQGDENAKMAIVLVRDGEIVATASNIIDYQSNRVWGTSDAPAAITFITDDMSIDGGIENIKAIYSISGIKMGTRRLNNIPTGTYIIYYEKDGNTCVTKFIK
ncbi:MAG: chitobiase/beta-hexosaminidase C-terminal domain-containing protein [Bacteroidaceae bacterium]|nr:chitobiase/beta-hexosaminidase C-terminal domain-containing protein [Bacteroidaceae bacterium]